MIECVKIPNKGAKYSVNLILEDLAERVNELIAVHNAELKRVEREALLSKEYTDWGER